VTATRRSWRGGKSKEMRFRMNRKGTKGERREVNEGG
jgi:hypothetical protein